MLRVDLFTVAPCHEDLDSVAEDTLDQTNLVYAHLGDVAKLLDSPASTRIPGLSYGAAEWCARNSPQSCPLPRTTARATKHMVLSERSSDCVGRSSAGWPQSVSVRYSATRL